MSSRSYLDASELRDEREFPFGSVWKIRDREIVIPQMDTTTTPRLLHRERWIVVISNTNENYHPLCPTVTVAPLSHRTDLKKMHDLELSSGKDNVKQDCLLQLKLMQPVLKADLYEYQGQIHDESKDELIVLLEDYFGIEL